LSISRSSAPMYSACFWPRTRIRSRLSRAMKMYLEHSGVGRRIPDSPNKHCRPLLRHSVPGRTLELSTGQPLPVHPTKNLVSQTGHNSAPRIFFVRYNSAQLGGTKMRTA
jgi:hypothetical protein